VSGGGVYAPRKTTNHDPEYRGILGFPSVASAEIGNELFDALSEWVAQVVREFCYGATPKSYSY
jgi:creatinine amidohydrolase/Fe(II)-dependent formamide hydrolase-like protein